MAELYVISPPKINLSSFADEFLRCHDKHQFPIFQLRLKDPHTEADILKTAEKIMPICQQRSVRFVMNDSMILAKKAGANSVHLGMDDFKAHKKSIAEICQEFWLGLSCYNNLEYALDAAAQGANMVAFGAFYPTTTTKAKAQAEVATLVNFKKQNQSATKVGVIGGINFENKKPLEDSGADYICMVSAAWAGV
jgi:thiamine-phosphate pyrophosphorylase